MRKIVPIIFILAALAGGAYLGFVRGGRAITTGPVIKVSFLTADLGNATLVLAPEGQAAVIDPGPASTSEALADYLSRKNIKSFIVVLTNLSSERAGGLSDLIDKFRVKRVVLGTMPARSWLVSRALRSAGADGIQEVPLAQGSHVNISNTVRLDVLSPPIKEDYASGPDDRSLITGITYQGKRFLLLSDAGARAQARLIETGANLRSNVLEVGRHGRRGGVSLEMLSLVRPEVCIVPVGAGSDRPSRVLLRRSIRETRERRATEQILTVSWRSSPTASTSWSIPGRQAVAEKTVRAFLDRVEGDVGVLLVGDDAQQVLWPAASLPEDAVEGCILEIVVRTDAAATEAAKNEIDSLIDRLNREQ